MTRTATKRTATKRTTAKRGAAKSKATKRGATKRKATKRELIDTGTDKRFVRRGAGGQFKESDDVGSR